MISHARGQQEAPRLLPHASKNEFRRLSFPREWTNRIPFFCQRARQTEFRGGKLFHARGKKHLKMHVFPGTLENHIVFPGCREKHALRAGFFHARVVGGAMGCAARVPRYNVWASAAATHVPVGIPLEFLPATAGTTVHVRYLVASI